MQVGEEEPYAHAGKCSGNVHSCWYLQENHTFVQVFAGEPYTHAGECRRTIHSCWWVERNHTLVRVGGAEPYTREGGVERKFAFQTIVRNFFYLMNILKLLKRILFW